MALDPKIIRAILASQQGHQGGSPSINPISMASKAINPLISALTNKGDWSKTLGNAAGSLGGLAGSLINPKYGGLAGNIVGSTIGDLIKGGSGTGWVTPSSILGILPGLIGMANPKAGQIAQAAYGVGNIGSQMAGYTGLGDLGASLTGLGGTGGTGAATGSWGAALGMSGLGPLAVIPLMLTLGKLLVGDDPTMLQKYGDRLGEIWRYGAAKETNPTMKANPKYDEYLNTQTQAFNEFDTKPLPAPTKSGNLVFPSTATAMNATLGNLLKENNWSNLGDMTSYINNPTTDPAMKSLYSKYLTKLQGQAPMVTKFSSGGVNPLADFMSGKTIAPDTWDKYLSTNKYKGILPESYVSELSNET
jgi:hypothetical protein